jgi:CheY-like chemotaxis protein
MEFQETDGFYKCSTMIDDMEPQSTDMVANRESPDARTRLARARPADATGSITRNDASRAVKRQTHDDESSIQMQKAATPVCLMATDKPTKQSNEVLTNLENIGWKIVIANDGQDALRLLQIRNWDAILIDDDIPLLAGTPCMEKFRSWEAENRVNRQRRAFLICSNVEIPSPCDKCSIVQPPHGFDGVLGKPVKWDDLNKMLQRNRERERSFDIVIRK